MAYPYTSGQVLTASDMNKQLFAITSERNNGFTTTGENLAFGNGSTNGEATLPIACQLVYASIYCEATMTGNVTITLLKNGAQVSGKTISRSGAGVATLDLSGGSEVSFAAGDTFNWEATTVSGTQGTTVVMSMFAAA